MRPSRAALLAAACTLLTVPTALAQTRSSIVGVITDSTRSVLPGATITLESPDLVGGTETTTSNEHGAYRFTNLPAGTYTLTASLTGFQSVRRTGLRLLFGTTATVDLALGVGVAETVVVEGRSPAVDVTTAQATNKVDADLIQATPIMADQRNGFEVFQLSPGINGRSAYGGARDANELLLDGTPTTIPERQGTNAAVINSNWLQEVQVVSLGASAEYGEFTGTVANFLVRSGSNDFHGLVEYKTTRPSWVGDNTGSLPESLRTRFTSQEILSQWDAVAQVGGPLKKDTLFFFAGFEYLKNEVQSAGAPSPVDSTFPRFIGKVSWAPSQTVRVEGTVNTSKSSTSGGGSATAGPETASLNILPNTIWTSRATWTPASRTLVELRTGGLYYKQDIKPPSGDRVSGPSPHRDVLTGISSVAPAQYRLQLGKRFSVGSSVTRYVDGWLGRGHAFKVGLDYEHFSFLTESGFPGGMSFQDRGGAPDLVVLWPGDVKEGIGDHTVVYAQDSWRLTDEVTLEPGVRVSFNRGSTSTHGDTWSTTPISPRLGLAWDVGGSHKTVVRAHYGRFHEGFGTVLYDFTDTDGLTPQVTARVLGPSRFQEINRTNPGANALDPGIRHAYMDQYLLGVEQEVLSDLSVKVQYIHRDYKDLWGYVDTRSIYQPVQVVDPGPDGRQGTADDGGPLTAFALQNPGQSNLILTNPEGAYRRYRAIQVVAQKRLSKNWQFLASYTRSRARGNVNNDIVDNYGGATPANGPFVNPNNLINADGPNTHDYPHEAMVRASYRLEPLGGLNLGAVYRYFSGAAWSRTATFRLAQGNQVIRMAPRGSEPSPAFNQVDVRIDKTFPLGSRDRHLGVYLDVFNLTNQGVADRARFTETSGGSFGLPLSWVSPRTIQLAARVTF